MYVTFIVAALGALCGPQMLPDTVVSLSLVKVIVADSGGMAMESIVDAAAAGDGSIYVLRANQRVQQYRGGELRREWGGKGTARGKFWFAQGLAVNASNQVYVLDAGLNAVSVFDSSGTLLDRTIMPEHFTSFVDMAVAPDGSILLSAYGGPEKQGQIFVLCPEVECPVRAPGNVRATRDSLATRFFQGGFLALAGDSVFFAGLNPFRIEKYDLVSGERSPIASSDFLGDAEALAFRHLPDDQLKITNVFPQSTGIVRLLDGRLVYSAFFPARAESEISIYMPDGRILLTKRLPTMLRVQDLLPNGDLLAVRVVDREELVEYRLQ